MAKKKPTKKGRKNATERSKRSGKALRQTDSYYCMEVGTWVAARLLKRVDYHGHKVPTPVKTWVTSGGNSHINENTKPTNEVLGWLAKTIEDPDWPRRA